MQSEDSSRYFRLTEGWPLLAKPVIHLLLIAVLGVLAYSNSFHGAFVFDDEPSIANNPVITDLVNFFSNATGYNYNPRRFVGYLTFALNYRLSGLDVTGYHIFNLAVHVINGLLVYALVRLTLRAPFFAGRNEERGTRNENAPNLEPRTLNLVPLLAALLFVVHPIQTQAVTYIVQRLTSLATMFYLMSLYLYGKGRLVQESAQASRWKIVPFYLLSLLSMVLAMKNKEIAFTLPIVVVLYEFAFFGTTLKKKLLLLVPVLLTMLVIPLSLLNVNKPLGEILSDVSKVAEHKATVSRMDYLLTQFSVITTYIRLLFWPANQNLDYDYPINHSLLTPRAALSFTFLLALLGLAVWMYYLSGSQERGSRNEVRETRFEGLFSSCLDPRISRLISFGILWFFITLAVESSVIPITDVIFEHRVYLPSVGVFIAVATAFAILSERYFREAAARLPAVIALTAVAALAVATYNRNRVWRDNVTLWEDVVRKSPGKVRGYNNLGAALSDTGRTAEAIELLRKAISIKPDHPEGYYNLGRIYLTSPETVHEAIRLFSMALLLRPDYDDAYVNLAAAYIKVGRYGDVVRLLEPVMAGLMERPDAHFNLGMAYFAMGNAGEAARELAIVRSLDPRMAVAMESYFNRPAPSYPSGTGSGHKGETP